MPNYSIFILSGGKSTRMKEDKSLMLFEGKPMIQHLIDRFKKLNSEIVIISNENSHLNFGLTVIKDNYKNCGPIGGIEAGLAYSQTNNNIFITCDNPFIECQLINYISTNPESSDIVFSNYNQLHPFPGLYTKDIHLKIKTLISEGFRKMTDLKMHFNVNEMDCKHFIKNNFINFNYPEDIKKWHENNT